jgi:hypothetical protein
MKKNVESISFWRLSRHFDNIWILPTDNGDGFNSSIFIIPFLIQSYFHSNIMNRTIISLFLFAIPHPSSSQADSISPWFSHLPILSSLYTQMPGYYPSYQQIRRRKIRIAHLMIWRNKRKEKTRNDHKVMSATDLLTSGGISMRPCLWLWFFLKTYSSLRIALHSHEACRHLQWFHRRFSTLFMNKNHFLIYSHLLIDAHYLIELEFPHQLKDQNWFFFKDASVNPKVFECRISSGESWFWRIYIIWLK